MTIKDDLADSLLDEGHAMSNIGEGEDFAEFLLDGGNPNFIKNPVIRRQPSNPRKKPNKQIFPPPPSPPTPPTPPTPPLKSKSVFWSAFKRLFWIVVVSFSLIKYCNKQTGDTNNNTILTASSKLDTFAFLKLGKPIVPAKSLYRDGKYLPQNDLADSIIVIQILNSNIHQYYVRKGKRYKSFESYVYVGNDQWRGDGDYRMKYSKRTRYLSIDADYFNNISGSCSFVSVLEKPMDYEIEVRGCDIEYDRNDDLMEVVYIYNSPEDPSIFKRRRGLVYSKFLSPNDSRNKTSRARVNRGNLEKNNGKLYSEGLNDNSSIKTNSGHEVAKIKQKSRVPVITDDESSQGQIETVNDSKVKNVFYIGQVHSGGYVFSLNKALGQGKIYHIPNNEKCKWRKISRLLKAKNENDPSSRCCSWRLPTAEELTNLFRSVAETNFSDGIYWTSSESVNLAVDIEGDNANSDFRDNWKGQLKSILTINRSDGQILESTKNQEHFVVFIRDFSFDEN